MIHLEEGQAVSIIPLADSVIIIPRRFDLNEARRHIRRILKQSNCSVEEMLAGLKDERTTVYEDLYGKKDG